MKNQKKTEPLKWYEKASKKRFTKYGSVQAEEKPSSRQSSRNGNKDTFKQSQQTSKSDLHRTHKDAAVTKQDWRSNGSTSFRQHQRQTQAQYSEEAPRTMQAQRTEQVTIPNADSSLFAPKNIPADAQEIITNFDSVLSSVHKMNSKQRALLPFQIRELSHELTDERGDRRLGYMNQTTTLSAYTYYFMWWNIVRLTRLFSNLQKECFELEDNGICLDIGSGPLTVPIALLLSRPELREKKLTWYCIDLSATSLAEGENIFLTVAAKLKCEPWKIIRVKGEMGTSIKQKASFVTCANVFNEIVEDSTMPPDFLAKKYCDKILSYINVKGDNDEKPSKKSVLVIEPGVPKAARFISLLRDSLIRKSFVPNSPCTHCGVCPMDGKKGGKWCNYVFSTEDAPKSLKKLSEEADLPKERAVLSFISSTYNSNFKQEEPGEEASQIASAGKTKITFRVASDEIRLPGNRTGYYACSNKGLLLVVTSKYLFSGESFTVEYDAKKMRTDKKSGALIIE